MREWWMEESSEWIPCDHPEHLHQNRLLHIMPDDIYIAPERSE